MIRRHTLVSILLYTTLSESRYKGKPIQVKADFHVVDEDTVEKRPRPFLNAIGQIDFHTTTLSTTLTYKTTFRPIWHKKPQPLDDTDPLHTKEEIPTKKPELQYYRPTFRPPPLIAEISHVAISTPAPTKSEVEVTTTTANEKVFDLTEHFNQLNHQSLLNISVLFGFPVVTALLSLLGFGPLAIVSAAWIIPLVTIYALPEILRGEQIEIEEQRLNL